MCAELSNFTEYELNQKTYEELSCWAEFTRRAHGELIFLSAINVFFSAAAFLGNTLIQVALNKVSSLHPPSKLLYRNLAITDLCVGIIVGPLKVAQWISIVNEKWNICYYTALANTLSGFLVTTVSILTLTALGLDRLLALMLGLRYRQVLTLRRTYIIIAVMWILSIVFPLIHFWKPLSPVHSRLYGTVFLVCLVTSFFSYTKIFITLRHNQNQVHNHIFQGQPSQAAALNTARYRKVLYSSLWVQIALVVCYLPFSITVALLAFKLGETASTVLHLTITLVYFNSSLNPLLYSWKIREVRQAVKETLRQYICLSH